MDQSPIYDANSSIAEDTDFNYSEYLSPDESFSELYSTASASSDMFYPGTDEVTNLEEFDKNLPDTVTLLKNTDGSKVYLVGTGHFSRESQNDVSKVMQAVKPHVLVVELCVDRANVMQMDEEAIVREAKDFSFDKLKRIFNEAGVFQGIIYVLFLKLSASLTKNHGIAPGGEFRRGLKEMSKLKGCLLIYGDRPLRITLKRALAKLSWWNSICIFFTLLFSKADISAEDIEKYKQKDILEEMTAKLLADYPDLSSVILSERDIYLTHVLQTAAEHSVYVSGKEKVSTRVVGIVGIGHCPGISKMWGTVTYNDVLPLLVIPEPKKSDIIIKQTLKASFICLTLVGVYYIIPIPKSWSSSIKSAFSSIISKVNFYSPQKLMEDFMTDNYDHINQHIFYVPTSIPGKGCDLNLFESQIATCCNCETKCDINSCSCLIGEKNYENGCLAKTTHVFECNSQCTCNSDCENRIVQLGPNSNLEIVHTGEKGFGLISKSSIKKGEFVCEYAGEVISRDEANRRRNEDNINYIFSLNEFSGDKVTETIIDATYIANVGRYINHSCDPNCVIVPVRVDSLVPKLAIFAVRDIESGEEITYNYGGVNDNECVTDGRKLCFCGSSKCLKYLPYNP